MSTQRARPPRTHREVVSITVLIVALGGACTVTDRVAVRRDASVDAAMDAADAQMDAAVDPVTNCPLPVTLPGATPTCSAALAVSRFTFGACACFVGLDSDVSLRVDAFDSASGPYEPSAPNIGGRLGSNAPTLLAGTTMVTGLMHVASGAGIGLLDAATLEVLGLLDVWAPLSGSAASVFGRGDVSIGGALILGTLDVTGDFYQTAGEFRMIDTLIVGGQELERTTEPVSPCDCTNDVAARVASAASENENVAVGLARDALVALATDRTLTLPCGRYVLDAIGEVAPSALTIAATGHVALFVAGDIAIDRLVVSLDAGATLDLFVAGALTITQDAPIGDPEAPSALRIYVGGRGEIVLAGAPFAAHLHAPASTVTVTADQDVYGAIYAETLSAEAALYVHQDLALGAEVTGCAP